VEVLKGPFMHSSHVQLRVQGLACLQMAVGPYILPHIQLAILACVACWFMKAAEGMTRAWPCCVFPVATDRPCRMSV
jgi:hypothetical protein